VCCPPFPSFLAQSPELPGTPRHPDIGRRRGQFWGGHGEVNRGATGSRDNSLSIISAPSLGNSCPPWRDRRSRSISSRAKAGSTSRGGTSGIVVKIGITSGVCVIGVQSVSLLLGHRV
jgi:hypothetical protein